MVASVSDGSVFVGSQSPNRQARVMRLSDETMTWFNGTTEFESSTLGTATSGWNTYVWRKQATTIDLYQNGVNVLSGSDSSTAFFIGQIGGVFNTMDADFSDIIAYNASLSASEINGNLSALQSRYSSQVPAQTAIA